MKNQQSGFTLIELVMVIVILGILAATALPKFVNLQADAKAGVVKGVNGSMQSANAIIYATAALQGKISAAGETVAVTGVGNVTVDYGYAADAAELLKVMTITDATITQNATYGTDGGIGYSATCSVDYTAAASAIVPPAYTADTSSC